MELWKGRFEKEIDPITNDFNQSIRVERYRKWNSFNR